LPARRNQLAELVSKVIERGLPADEVPILVSSLNLEIIPLTQEQAELTGILRQTTRHLGLSLGDRACLALAKTLGGMAITADRPWQRSTLASPSSASARIRTDTA